MAVNATWLLKNVVAFIRMAVNATWLLKNAASILSRLGSSVNTVSRYYDGPGGLLRAATSQDSGVGVVLRLLGEPGGLLRASDGRSRQTDRSVA